MPAIAAMQIIGIIFNDADRAGDKASFAGVKVEKNKSCDSNCVFLIIKYGLFYQKNNKKSIKNLVFGKNEVFVEECFMSGEKNTKTAR